VTVQKEDVTIRYCEYDDTFISETVQHRNVNRPKNGRPYINVTGGRRYLDQDDPPLVIYKPLSAPFDASFDATIGKWLRSLPPGTNVKVVPLP
jgi:hypothetical protein